MPETELLEVGYFAMIYFPSDWLGVVKRVDLSGEVVWTMAGMHPVERHY